MKISKKQKIIIAFETAIKGGSISVFRDDEIIDFMIGNKLVSGAEDLLPKINLLLERNNISKSDISAIVNSNGPGSFTGIRIGIATALALSKSMKCQSFGVDLIQAMTHESESNDHDKIIAVSFGRDRICWTYSNFKSGSYIEYNDNIKISDLDYFTTLLKDQDNISLVADFNIYNIINKLNLDLDLSCFGENLSHIIGKTFFRHPHLLGKLRPFYLQESNFIS